MARMFPQRIIDETKSNAERKLFAQFEQDLGSEFTVFHSVAWLAKSSEGKAFDGEADFLIVHPNLGILVLEVKGGRIEYDGGLGKWFSTDKRGYKHPLTKDPLTQAKDARYNLYRKLRESALTRSFSYPTYHAVCFPDITVSKDLRLDAPEEIILDRRRIFDIEKSINEIFIFWDSHETGKKPGPAGVDALIQLLAPHIELQSFMGVEFEGETAQIKQLTEQQFMALDLLSRERRAIVFGCAGSGKTMLALEKARRLAEDGHSVLLTCFNSRLADWLDQSPFKTPDVKIINFHSLCVELAKRAKVPIPPMESEVVQDDQDYFFEQVLPQVLVTATKQLGPQHTALIVDEAQDFKESWWAALEGLLVEPRESVFYIFADDNQNIYVDAEQHYPFAGPSVTLNRNCRNTKEIQQIVARYYRGTLDLRAQGPQGRKPEILPLTSSATMMDLIRKHVKSLVDQEHVKPDDIVILTPRSEKSSHLHAGMLLDNFVLTWRVPQTANEIECSSIHAFKGLERPVVILAELDRLTGPDVKKLTYIGVSRARNHLIVVGALP